MSGGTGRRALAGAVLAFGALALAEGALRVLPFGGDEPAFSGGRSPARFVPGSGPERGRLVTGGHLRGVMNYQSFAAAKAPGVFRVFVVGGSAAYGYPLTEEYGFTGYLRRALDAALPGGFEIVNAAAMSYGSHRVLDLLGEVVRYAPDLVVVYCGNNEYVERNVLPPRGATEDGVGRLRDALRRLRLYRAVRALLFRVAPDLVRGKGEGDITDLLSRPVSRAAVERTAANDRTVLENYRRNLDGMVRLLRNRGVPAVFCTVPVNLADWPPDRTPPGAYAAYERGRALLRAGDGAAAREQLERARDLDPRVLRALSSFNASVRALGAEGVAVADLEGAFARRSPGGVPGEDLFVDYVHPTAEGHRLIAEELLPIILRDARATNLEPTAASHVREDRAEPRDPRMIGLARYARAMTLQQQGRIPEAAALYREILDSTPVAEAYGNLATIVYESSGDLAEARRLLERGLALEPENGPLLLEYATVLFIGEDFPRAAEHFRRALALNPLYARANACLGHIALREGRPGEAVAQFEEAAAKGHETADMLGDWSSALRELGRSDEAGRIAARARAAGAPAAGTGGAP